MRDLPFKRKLLASSIASCSLFGSAGLSVAQPLDEPMVLEEVVVVGIRGSLQRSMDIKRDSRGVVDAISAEDIGKMPDTNLAESLQRITGVSIDRVGGEGSRVTVRGFGPDFNVVTLNGRTMPSANIEPEGPSDSRSFDFANLAAESVSGVEVYKTGKAFLPTGGIGSVINISTAKPLESPDLVVNFGVKAQHDDTVDEGDNWTPEVSGIYSQQFQEGKFGVAVSGSYSERDYGLDVGKTPNGWYAIDGGQGDWGSIPPDSTTFENPPQVGETYAVPRNINYSFDDVERTRTNYQLTLQWAPNEKMTATLDYTYAELEVETEHSDIGAWFNGNPVSGVFTGGTVKAPVIYSDSTGDDTTFASGAWKTTNETESLGFNFEWLPTDNLTLMFDYHDSEAENQPDDDRGSNNLIASAQYNRVFNTVNYSNDLPILSLDLDEPLDPAQMLSSGTSFRNSYMKHTIEQAQIQGVFNFDERMVQSIDFGLSYTDSENRSAYSFAQRETWGGYGTAEDYDDSLWERSSLPGQFDNVSGAGNPDFEPYYYEADFNGLRQAVADVATANGDNLGPCGPWLCAPSEYTTDRTIKEEMSAAYTQVNFGWEDFELNGWDLPMGLSIGMRYEDTDLDADAVTPIYDQLLWEGDNEFNAKFTDSGVISDDNSYDKWLPNVDWDVQVIDSVVVRASYSETMTRPNYNDLQAGKTIDIPIRFNGGTGTSGNPKLKPFESENWDFSAEWYYEEDSYISAGYYRKDVDNFIGNTTVDETLFDLPHPAQGPRHADAVAFLGTDDPAEVRPYMESLYGAPVAGDASLGDPSTVFALTTPVNVESATIDGWELAVQHMFGDSGFGVVVNYTTVDGDIEYDNANTNKAEGAENQFALLGLSDSFNFVGFYSNYGLEARVAYNWRDEFLDDTVDGSGRNPVYVDDYGQWDVNVSYDVTDQFTVAFEGINITEETYRKFSRTDRMVLEAQDSGARYSIGVRYKF